MISSELVLRARDINMSDNTLVSSQVIKHAGIQFGTSGARGLVEQFTPDVCAAFTYAFINSIDDVFAFKSVAVAIDNRPSSPLMAQAVLASIEAMGLEAIYYGVLPTPALAYSAMQDSLPCIMITGSHIPFDRNGIKFYRPDGEITKVDEQSIIDANVMFKPPMLREYPSSSRASRQYVSRYTELFSNSLLSGKRVGIYEHSSAGRDLYQGLFEALGADVIPLERTNKFVPIDTEAVADVDKERARSWSTGYDLDFIFSTDGDGDRPLVADENGEWLRGDILGLLCAKAMKIEALAIPISCNTIIAQMPCFRAVNNTKIGSPYVISEFSSLAENYETIAGFEANGGFLLGSDTRVNGNLLRALPTRDAVLPALMLLSEAKSSSIVELVGLLPKRFTHSDRLQSFPTEKSLSILSLGSEEPEKLIGKLGLEGANLADVNLTDGLRLTLTNGRIIHLRPSGNAPELRCYAEAETFETAKKLVSQVLNKIQLL